MHLAICDDNIADRKQMERLLGRESLKRKDTDGAFYVDSFGNKNAVLSTPMIYDGLFMDMTEEGNDAVEIANLLRAGGSGLPIIFCCSRIDYRKAENLPDNCFFLDKPIQTEELAAMCSQLQSLVDSREKKMEFRTDTEAFYLTEEEIAYAYQENRTVRVTLTDGSVKAPVTSMLNFCSMFGFDVDYSNRGIIKLDLGFIRISESAIIAMIGASYLVNLKYVEKVGFAHLLMKDGAKIKIAPSSRKLLRQAVEEAREL